MISPIDLRVVVHVRQPLLGCRDVGMGLPFPDRSPPFGSDRRHARPATPSAPRPAPGE